MAITPQTVLRLVKVPLEIDNKNQLTFQNEISQRQYFLSLPHLEITEISYQRKDNVIYFPEHIDSIIKYFMEKKDVKYVSKIVDNDYIADKHDYNLSVSTYVEQEDTREVIDITELNKEIARIVEREAQLRTEIDNIVAEIEAGELWITNYNFCYIQLQRNVLLFRQ